MQPKHRGPRPLSRARSIARALALLAVLAAPVVAPRPTAAGDKKTPAERADEAKALLASAREQGQAWLQREDKDSKKEARKALEKAQDLFHSALEDDEACEACAEGLVAVDFHQAYYGFDDYKDCVERATKLQQRFPANGKIAYYKGYAHHNAGQHKDASRDLNRYLLGASGDPATEAQVREVLKASQDKFLSSWNNQANFYESNESRLVWWNAQAARNEIAFQATPDIERQLGAQAFQQLTTNAPKVEDAELKSYLDGVVARLVNNTPGTPFTYQVTVVDTPEVNAVTPPGHIIVYTGLLGFAESESELAGVLAHELAHNYGHHASRKVIKAIQGQMVAAAITQAINPQSTWAQLATQLGTGFGLNLFVNAYSRFEEKEADLYGAHILYNAGYDPTAMSTMFLKLYKANPKQPPKFLSTHPPSPDRADYITDYLESFPLDKEMRADSQDFQKLRARFGRGGPSEGPKDRGALPALP